MSELLRVHTTLLKGKTIDFFKRVRGVVQGLLICEDSFWCSFLRVNQSDLVFGIVSLVRPAFVRARAAGATGAACAAFSHKCLRRYLLLLLVFSLIPSVSRSVQVSSFSLRRCGRQADVLEF